MKKAFLIAMVSVFSISIFAAEGSSDPEDPTHSKMSAIPRLIRENPSPQVFFQDISGSLQISTTGNYNRIMNGLSIALKKKMKANLIVNKQTGIIIDIDAPPENHDTTMYEDISEDNKDKKEEKSDLSKTKK